MVNAFLEHPDQYRRSLDGGACGAEVIELVERFAPAGPAEHLASKLIAGMKHLPMTARQLPSPPGRAGSSGPELT